ncbi:hypothetical protein M0812_14255 [Anaeramoeba flamelloides]|uniref:DUF3293 domain-containing protein n=1 Tax=Anaeramoeba flamelloides TaxID=1746091 RepID=A0AAV7ZHK9_9EUKA|nr:hypothetical protein M0812_14255 [Anaeramoeba flamelloides]
MTQNSTQVQEMFELWTRCTLVIIDHDDKEYLYRKKEEVKKQPKEDLGNFFLEKNEPEKEWFILTAYNPFGIDRSEEINEKANKKLKTVLLELNYESIYDSYGSDPEVSYKEYGFAVECLKSNNLLEKILAIGSQFSQIAIYKIEIQNNKVFNQILLTGIKNYKIKLLPYEVIQIK